MAIQIGKGATFATRAAGTADAFVTVGKLKDIKAPGLEIAFEDATVQDSANDAEEVEPTLLKAGAASFGVLFDSTDPTHINAAGGIIYQARTKTKLDGKITLKNGSYVTFTGWYSKCAELSAPIKGLCEMPVEFMVTGLPVWP